MEKIIYEKVGQRLKFARELKGITLEEAGKLAGVHKSTILRWENGATEKFKIPILELLAHLYNVNPAWLMGYDVPIKEQTEDILKKIGAIPLTDMETIKIPILRNC